MKLTELLELGERFRKLHPNEDPDVVVRTMNPSVGGVAVVQVYPGGDWDKGRFFLGIDDPVCRVAKVTQDQIRARAEEWASNTHERLGFEFPHRRRDCWLAGFIEGAGWGITKLAEANPEPGQPREGGA